MPWCPKCSMEYRKGFTVCADCGLPLTDQPPQKQAQKDAPVRPTALYTVTGTVEADMLCEMLRREGIACYAREQDLGQGAKLYTGLSLFGTDIMIEQGNADRAQAVLTAFLKQRDIPIEEAELARQALGQDAEAAFQTEEARETTGVRVFRGGLAAWELAGLLAIVLAGIMGVVRLVKFLGGMLP